MSRCAAVKKQKRRKAGAMIFVVVEEVIPETQLDKYTDIAALGFIGGFVVMMTLDVALGG